MDQKPNASEFEKYLEFLLTKLIPKQPSIPIDTDFIMSKIKSSYIIVNGDPGRHNTQARYVDWYVRCIDKGAKRVHVLARGKRNLAVAYDLFKDMDRDRRLNLVYESHDPEELWNLRIPSVCRSYDVIPRRSPPMRSSISNLSLDGLRLISQSVARLFQLNKMNIRINRINPMAVSK